MKIAHVEASNVMPSYVSSQVSENVPEKLVGNSQKSDLLKNLSKENGGRVKKILESFKSPKHRVMDRSAAAIT